MGNDMKVVAFDIDGSLTEDNVMSVYMDAQKRDGLKVGILTARSRTGMETFIEENDLTTDFEYSGLFKSIHLLRLRRRIESDEYIYIGNTGRDWFSSTATQYTFLEADEVTPATLTQISV